MPKNWKLISKETGKEIKLGMEVINFRGRVYKLSGGNPPNESNSSGFIFVEDENKRDWLHYPNNFGLKWEKK
ncbi:MAG: hypothetical protein GY714_19925 [Desulfobacterales bacterium]|nr:hypothetical protein [Desulfobacterales bacterium]